MNKPISIIGGGIAGLTLGIGLRQRGMPVTLWEAGHYPRHRVCGEFISGRGQNTLSRLGLLKAIIDTGALYAHSVAFFDETGSMPPHPLPLPALCISRFVLDHLLANEFQHLGGDLRTGERWRGADAPGIIHASGRRLQPVVNGFRWIGLKAHARELALAADMELHFLASGYIGLCRLPGDRINVCGLFRNAGTFSDLSTSWRQWLAGDPGSVLHERLEHARYEPDSFSSVAGLDIRPHQAMQSAECRIGDAITMIPPMTGNGMSMALEAAEIAIAPLVEYSRGATQWPDAQRQIAKACDQRFQQRLFYACWLQRAAFHPTCRRSLIALIQTFPKFGDTLFGLTR